MKLFINDNLIEMESSLLKGSQRILDLLNAVIDSGFIPEDEIIMAIEIDGKSYEPGDAAVEEIPFDFTAVDKVELDTKPALELLTESMNEGEKCCRNLAEDSKRIAELFRTQRLADANDSYSILIANIQDILRDLSQLQEFIISMSKNAENDRFDNIWKRFHDVAQETIAFQEDADWVMLADLLEYEFSEIFSDFGDYLSEMQGLLSGE